MTNLTNWWLNFIWSKSNLEDCFCGMGTRAALQSILLFINKQKELRVRKKKKKKLVQRALEHLLQNSCNSNGVLSSITKSSSKWNFHTNFHSIAACWQSKLQDDAEMFKCDCGRVYKSKGKLSRHLKFECNKEATFFCSFCTFKSKRKENLKAHVALKHAEILFWVYIFSFLISLYFLEYLLCSETSLRGLYKDALRERIVCCQSFLMNSNCFWDRGLIPAQSSLIVGNKLAKYWSRVCTVFWRVYMKVLFIFLVIWVKNVVIF